MSITYGIILTLAAALGLLYRSHLKLKERVAENEEDIGTRFKYEERYRIDLSSILTKSIADLDFSFRKTLENQEIKLSGRIDSSDLQHFTSIDRLKLDVFILSNQFSNAEFTLKEGEEVFSAHTEGNEILLKMWDGKKNRLPIREFYENWFKGDYSEVK